MNKNTKDENGKVTILINSRPYHFDHNSLTPDEFRNAVGGATNDEVWKIVKSPDPEGQLPVDDIQITESVTVQNGERFRVVAPGTFGAQAIPVQLAREIDDLRNDFPDISVQQEGDSAVVIIPRFPVRTRRYTKSLITLLLKVPLSYPNGRPDMFWTDHDFVRADGSVPRSADAIETIQGRPWRRFSWHIPSWNPATHDLRTYLAFVEVGIQKAAA